MGLQLRLKPRDVLLGLPQKEKRTQVVELILSCKIPANKPQSKLLEKISETIFESGANILIANPIHTEESMYMIFFLDLSKAKVSTKKLKGELEKLEFSDEVRVLEPNPLFLDVAHFPLTNGMERVCIISMNALAQMHEEMINILGSGAFTVLWHIGLKRGEALIKLIKELIPSNVRLKQEEMLKAFKQIYQARGWGIIEYVGVNMNQKTGKIRIHHSIAENVRKKYDMPICYYAKGNLAALLQEVFNCKAAYLNEVKCMAMRDPYCEFEFEC